MDKTALKKQQTYKRKQTKNGQLTVFLVQKYLHLLLFQALKGVLQFPDGSLVCQVAVHEAARARLLHHLGPVVARQLAESVIAVDDRVVYDPGIGQDETGI